MRAQFALSDLLGKSSLFSKNTDSLLFTEITLFLSLGILPALFLAAQEWVKDDPGREGWCMFRGLSHETTDLWT